MIYQKLVQPELSIIDYTFFVDHAVNVDKTHTLETALENLVPEDKRSEVRAEYERWHKAEPKPEAPPANHVGAKVE